MLKSTGGQDNSPHLPPSMVAIKYANDYQLLAFFFFFNEITSPDCHLLSLDGSLWESGPDQVGFAVLTMFLSRSATARLGKGRICIAARFRNLLLLPASQRQSSTTHRLIGIVYPLA